MNFYEEIVHYYLTEKLGFLVKPNLKVTKDESGKSWTAQIDFFALDLVNKTAYLVEVTAHKALPKHFKSKLDPNDRGPIEHFVREHIGLKKLAGHKLVWLLIVPTTYTEALAKLQNIEQAIGDGTCEIKGLDEILDSLKL
jgi:hypothetical protein